MVFESCRCRCDLTRSLPKTESVLGWPFPKSGPTRILLCKDMYHMMPADLPKLSD